MPRHTRVILLAAIAAGCATNPVTGRSELALISEGQEIQMGQQYAEEVKAAYGLYDNAGVQAYVNRLGMQLAAESERPQIPWQFNVIDDAAVNAFALPGGFVYINRGLIERARTASELAGVLGHEIAHVVLRHSAERIEKAQKTNVGVSIVCGLTSLCSSDAARRK